MKKFISFQRQTRYHPALLIEITHLKFNAFDKHIAHLLLIKRERKLSAIVFGLDREDSDGEALNALLIS